MLFALICSPEKRDDLGSCAEVNGHELAAGTLDDAGVQRPVHSGKGIAGNISGVTVAGHQILQGYGIARLGTEEEHYSLSPGAGIVRAEEPIAGPAGDAVFSRPENGIVVIRILGHIPEGGTARDEDAPDIYLACRHDKGERTVAVVDKADDAALGICCGQTAQTAVRVGLYVTVTVVPAVAVFWPAATLPFTVSSTMMGLTGMEEPFHPLFM